MLQHQQQLHAAAVAVGHAAAAVCRHLAHPDQLVVQVTMVLPVKQDSLDRMDVTLHRLRLLRKLTGASNANLLNLDVLALQDQRDHLDNPVDLALMLMVDKEDQEDHPDLPERLEAPEILANPEILDKPELCVRCQAQLANQVQLDLPDRMDSLEDLDSPENKEITGHLDHQEMRERRDSLASLVETAIKEHKETKAALALATTVHHQGQRLDIRLRSYVCFTKRKNANVIALL